jgi:predicted cupin superfamily sugar epimerase
MTLTAAQIIELLGLQPPTTCGFVNETFRSAIQIPASALPPEYAGARPLGNVLYFLVTPKAMVRLHRIRSDQMYHHYLGEPIDVLLLYSDGRHEVRRVGSDLSSGMSPQLFIPGGTFHTARVPADANYALLATSVWARAEPSDVEMGKPELLMHSFPEARTEIMSFSG